MGKKEKLIKSLRSKPRDFTFLETETLLGYFGYVKEEGAGSRVKFAHEIASPIVMHAPHPRKELLEYQVRQLLRQLEEEGFIYDNEI